MQDFFHQQYHLNHPTSNLKGVRLLGDVAPELGLVDSSLNRDAVGSPEFQGNTKGDEFDEKR